MAKRYDVVATLKFTKKDNTEGKSYVRCGTAFDGDKGIRIKLDAVPISPEWDGWLNLYEPKAKEGDAAKPTTPKAGNDDDSDLPF